MRSNANIAIVDYGMGNTFSIQNACSSVGLKAKITFSHETIRNANALILPGVGAFGEAMTRLNKLELTPIIKEFACSGRPLIGICLGMQLLLSNSEEFGYCEGLDIIPGKVIRLEQTKDTNGNPIKIPHVGWTEVNPPSLKKKATQKKWGNTLLNGLQSGSSMYFVHSYYVQPDAKDVILGESVFGESNFCSAVQLNNITAFQFHPERSGKAGLRIYRNLAKSLQTTNS